VAYFLGLLVVLIISMFVIPNYGITEAGIISSLSYLVTAVFYMLYFSRDAKIKVKQLFPSFSDIPWLLKRVKGMQEK
jgi:O-antigen/teichoic acid export membrane protein